MHRTNRQIIACACVALAAACASGPAPVAAAEPVPAPVTAPVAPAVGGDRDEHGCIGSAGYQWCAGISACARPWELASERGFANTAEAFAAFCVGQTTPQ
jgi:hypothetical protein